jgi:hypothetical protein
MSQSLFKAVFEGPNDVFMAKRIINVAVIVSAIAILISLVFVVAGFFTKSTNEVITYAMDPWILADIIVATVFTFFLYKRRIWAAIVLSILVVIDMLVFYIEFERIPSALALLKLLIFIGGVKAILFLNKAESRVDNGDA